MTRNRELLNKAADRIEAIPESYDQYEYQVFSTTSPCGTAACLAGEVIICSMPTIEEGLKKLEDVIKNWGNNDYLIGSDPGTVAGNLVGLTTLEVRNLFNKRNSHLWPEPFCSEWREATTSQDKAKAAADLLRYLANDGMVPMAEAEVI